jgi:chromosome segregation ATPase
LSDTTLRDLVLARPFLRRITAQGFRGIGPKATLDLTPGPGLTLVVGRNGSGKSSFAEGLELLLTGDTYRWSQRSKVPFFLSYNELGSLLDEGPSKLYDALSKVLGLDALVDAQTALQQARSARDKARKDADQERKALLARLEDVDDERAQRIKDALSQKQQGPSGRRLHP